MSSQSDIENKPLNIYLPILQVFYQLYYKNNNGIEYILYIGYTNISLENILNFHKGCTNVVDITNNKSNKLHVFMKNNGVDNIYIRSIQEATLISEVDAIQYKSILLKQYFDNKISLLNEFSIGTTYYLTCEDEPKYVGSTTQDLNERFASHLTDPTCSGSRYVRDIRISDPELFKSIKIEKVEQFFIESTFELRCMEQNLLDFTLTEGYELVNQKNVVQTLTESERKLIYRTENPEKIIQIQHDYYLRNRDKIREIHNEYYAENKEKILTRMKAFRDKHKKRLNDIQKKRYHDLNKEVKHYCFCCEFTFTTKQQNNHNKTKTHVDKLILWHQKFNPLFTISTKENKEIYLSMYQSLKSIDKNEHNIELCVAIISLLKDLNYESMKNYLNKWYKISCDVDSINKVISYYQPNIMILQNQLNIQIDEKTKILNFRKK